MADKRFKVIIVDDEEVCIKNLEASLAKFPWTELAGTAGNVLDARKLILSLRPDLLFLDVEMPGKTGLDLLRELKDIITWDMQVIFYTAYDKYLLDALRASAFDFLLKPYTGEEFRLMMTRFFEQTRKQGEIGSFRLNVEKLIQNKAFVVTTATGYRILKVEHIVAFQYHRSKKSWSALLSEGKYLRLKRGTSAEVILNHSPSFLQISQQYIINFDYLSLINHDTCILFPPFDDLQLKISRKFLRALLDRFESI
jgi:Response regulator of the LytR/AlgR family